MSAFVKKFGPGLVVVLLVAFLSQFLASKIIPNIGAVTVAIVAGILASNLLIQGPSYTAGYDFAEKKLLPIAIVLLGAELQLQVLIGLGLPTAVLILLIVISTMLSSILIGRLLGFSSPFSLLMGAGNAICGSSAIAAISPLVEGKEEDVGLSISTVNLMGTIGIFLLPVLVRAFHMNDTSGGAVIGGSLQAIGQVVAAGYSVNDATGNIALLVKMGRVLMLGPLAILISSRNNGASAEGKSKIKIPTFIIGFLIIGLLASWQMTPRVLVEGLTTGGKWLLLFAMAGIGLKLRLKTMLQQGPKALLFGIALAVLQIAVALVIVLLIF